MPLKSIEIKTKDDIIICTPNDFSMITPYVLFEKSDWYKPEIEFIREYLKPGMHFLDVGACFGVYSLLAAKLVGKYGKVTAFENDLDASKFLELSVKKNKFSQFSMVCKAVSDSENKIGWQPGSSPELSRLDDNGIQQVDPVTIDSWWLEEGKPEVNVFKININGAEKKVIDAASSFLKESKPILLISATSENFLKLKSTLEEINYQLFEYIPGSGILTPFVDSTVSFDRNLIALTPHKVSELKEEGWIMNEDLSFDVPDSETWKSLFEKFSWSNSLMFGWEYMADLPENETYFEALNYLIAAEKISSSDKEPTSKKNQVTCYMIESVKRLVDLYNSGVNNISVAFTLVRGLIALGKRDQAKEIMQQMINETAFGQKNMGAPLPYLLPIEGQEFTNINTEYSKWLMVRSIESWLLTQNESTYWSGDQELKIIEILEGNPEISTSLQNIHKIRNYSDDRGSNDKGSKRKKSKSILFITTDFPPYDGGRVGHSVRAYTLANFFAENGFDVNLMILAKLDADREAPYMHPNIRILNSIYHEQKAVNDDLSVMEFCTDFMEKYSVSTLFTSTPPLTSSFIGLQIKERLGESIYWISDFRDFAHIHPVIRSKDPEKYLKQKILELKVMKESDSVLNVSTGMIKLAEELHNEFEEKIDLSKFEIVENGYIEQDKVAIQKDILSFAKKAKSEGRVVMYYAGTGTLCGLQEFEGVNKDLTFIFDVFEKNPQIAQNYALIIQGKVHVNLDYLKTLNSKFMFNFFDPVSNQQMQSNLEVADIGLNVNSDKIQAPYIMGGKVYDYVNSGLALLLIYPDNPFSLQEFSSKHGDKCFFANVFEPESVKDVLSKIILEKHNLDSRKFTHEEAKPYNRSAQYNKILALIDNADEMQNNEKFIHFCYNSIYAQTIADLLKYTNETSNQHHVLYVEQEVILDGFSVNLDAHPDAYIFNKKTDSQKILSVITDEDTRAIFMHGLFRPWQFNIVNTIGDHKHVGWMVWGGDLYNPIKNGITHLFPSKKISSIHTPIEGDRTLFSRHWGEVQSYDFGYLYPGLYGSINPELPNEKTKQIIVGNSGDPSNNHIEILTQLATKIDIHEYKIILPVAYGFHNDYKHLLVRKIEELGLQKQVIFHEEFISPKDYLQLVAHSDMMIMAHNRQQAMGNLLMALYLNKPAFLRKEHISEGERSKNLGWTFLTSAKLSPLAFEDLEKFKKLSDIPVNDEQLHQKNQDVINSHFGIKKRSKLLINSCDHILQNKSESKEKVLV